MPFLPLLLALLSSVTSLGGTLGRIHPADAPDIDLRIRIEKEELQYRIVMNLAFVDEIVSAPREDDTRLHPVEYPGVREALSEFFRKQNLVEVDGIPVRPVEGAFEVQEPDYTLLPLFPRLGTKALYKIRFDLSFPLKSKPRRIAMRWHAYPPKRLMDVEPGETEAPMEIKALLIAGGEDKEVLFKKDEPEYVWHRLPGSERSRFFAVPAAPARPRLELPVFTVLLSLLSLMLLGLALRKRSLRPLLPIPLVLAGAFFLRASGRFSVPSPFSSKRPLPDEQKALAIFLPLHANIYRAFDYSKESDVYDALSRSVDGRLLESMYAEIYKSLIQQEQGGALSRVRSVDPLETKVVKIAYEDVSPGFRVETRWRVKGAVVHWGHTHERTNEYRARYDVALRSSGWRIAAAETLSQKRIEDAGLETRNAVPKKGY